MNAHIDFLSPHGRTRTATVDVLLLPGFSLLALAAVIEPLRRANLKAQRFRLRLVSLDGAEVASAAGAPLGVDAALGSDRAADYTLLCAEPQAKAPDSLADHLRWLWRSGKTVVGIGGGTFLLARAGILAGRRFTLHWEHRSLFFARWPHLSPRAEIFCRDDRIITCAGEMAAADLILDLIEDHCGAEVGQETMDLCLMTSKRSAADEQTAAIAARLGSRNRSLLAAVAWIEENFRSETGIEPMYAQIGVSARQLQRLFKLHVGTSPHQYLIDQRLRHARVLLAETDLSISDIAAQCGYESPSQFSRAFKKRFGQTPFRFCHFPDCQAS